MRASRSTPYAGLQHRRARFDALFESAVVVEREDRHAVEVDALVAAADGVDDRLAVVGALAYPERAAALPERICRLPEEFGLEALGALLKNGGERIVDGRGDDTEHEGHDSAGVTNCQADIPAERATTSSSRRDKLR